MKLHKLQHGTFDSVTGEYEFLLTVSTSDFCGVLEFFKILNDSQQSKRVKGKKTTSAMRFYAHTFTAQNAN